MLATPSAAPATSPRALTPTASEACPPQGRAVAWSPTYETRCPRGHHLPNHAFPLPAGAVRCQHRDAPGAAPCHALTYVLTAGAAGVAFSVGPVTWEEVRHIREQDLAPLAALEYLGVRFTVTPAVPATR